MSHAGPIVLKTARALWQAAADFSANTTSPPVDVVHFGMNATVALLRPGPHQVVLSFKVGYRTGSRATVVLQKPMPPTPWVLV
jgi:hypothetical protein